MTSKGWITGLILAVMFWACVVGSIYAWKGR